MLKKTGAVAVIEIANKDARMRVSQLYKGSPVTLDYLEYPLRLGHDVFETGSVSFESLRELSGALEKFSAALLSYNIQKPRVISCTALREARNRPLVADQLRVRNDVDVTVLEDSQEKAYLFSQIIGTLKAADFLQNGNSVIAYVGSGTIGVGVYDGEKIVYFQNISMGVLKLHDILHGMRNAGEDIHTVVEEYLDTILNRIDLTGLPIRGLILTGSLNGMIARLCGAADDGDLARYDPARLRELYGSIRSMSTAAIARRYGIDEEQAALLYVALAIYNAMLRFCPDAGTVWSPGADITEAVSRCMLLPKADAERETLFRRSAVACAERTARRFGCDLTHSDYIRDCAGKLFDKLRKLHGLDSSKRLILELASLLHSCGSFVSVRQHNKCTYDLIRGMDLFGLSEQEVLETAFVAGSIVSSGPVEEDPDFIRLSPRERLVISKLAAIFRLANAMDKSHRQKLQEMKVELEDDKVLIKCSAQGDTLLEQWAFQESAHFFKEVFGLSPELSVKFKLKYK